MASTRPGSFVPPSRAGTRSSYQSSPAFTTLAPDTFRAYLLEKGLDDRGRRAVRRPRAGPAEPTSEIFRRSIKARILVAGPGRARPPIRVRRSLPVCRSSSSSSAQRLAGEPASERDVVMRLLLDGAPLEAAQVDVRRLDDRTVDTKATTDGEGRVRLRLGPGSWVATSVHLDPSQPGDGGLGESVVIADVQPGVIQGPIGRFVPDLIVGNGARGSMLRVRVGWLACRAPVARGS